MLKFVLFKMARRVNLASRSTTTQLYVRPGTQAAMIAHARNLSRFMGSLGDETIYDPQTLGEIIHKAMVTKKYNTETKARYEEAVATNGNQCSDIEAEKCRKWMDGFIERVDQQHKHLFAEPEELRKLKVPKAFANVVEMVNGELSGNTMSTGPSRPTQQEGSVSFADSILKNYLFISAKSDKERYDYVKKIFRGDDVRLVNQFIGKNFKQSTSMSLAEVNTMLGTKITADQITDLESMKSTPRAAAVAGERNVPYIFFLCVATIQEADAESVKAYKATCAKVMRSLQGAFNYYNIDVQGVKYAQGNYGNRVMSPAGARDCLKRLTTKGDSDLYCSPCFPTILRGGRLASQLGQGNNLHSVFSKDVNQDVNRIVTGMFNLLSNASQNTEVYEAICSPIIMVLEKLLGGKDHILQKAKTGGRPRLEISDGDEFEFETM